MRQVVNQVSSIHKSNSTKCHNKIAIIFGASKQPLTSKKLVTHSSQNKPKERHEFEKIKPREENAKISSCLSFLSQRSSLAFFPSFFFYFFFPLKNPFLLLQPPAFMPMPAAPFLLHNSPH